MKKIERLDYDTSIYPVHFPTLQMVIEKVQELVDTHNKLLETHSEPVIFDKGVMETELGPVEYEYGYDPHILDKVGNKNMKKGNITIHDLGYGHGKYGIESKGAYPFLVRVDIKELKDLHSLLSEILETDTVKEECEHQYSVGCFKCGATEPQNEEPTTPEKKCEDCGITLCDKHLPPLQEKKCCEKCEDGLNKIIRLMCEFCPCHQEKLPTSSYEVTCGRCEKSIKHSCGRV